MDANKIIDMGTNLLYDEKTGAAWDVSKVGPSGNIAKFVSDEG